MLKTVQFICQLFRILLSNRCVLVFYHLCYEGNVDLDSINDINLKHTHEVQIMEFGQIPKQVFKVPHPQRKVGMLLLKEPNLSNEIVDSSQEGISLLFKQSV